MTRKAGEKCWGLDGTNTNQARAEEAEFCPKVLTGLDLIKVQCSFFTYKVVILFLGANDLKVISWRHVQHGLASDVRLLLATIASVCPRTLGVILVDPLPLVGNRSYTQANALWDLTISGRQHVSDEYASILGDVAFEQRNMLSPRLSIEHVPTAGLAHADECADGAHYNGSATATALTSALVAAVQRVLGDKEVFRHHEQERLKARAAAREHK